MSLELLLELLLELPLLLLLLLYAFYHVLIRGQAPPCNYVINAYTAETPAAPAAAPTAAPTAAPAVLQLQQQHSRKLTSKSDRSPPGGDHRRPPTLWRPGQLVIEFLFCGFLVFLGDPGSIYGVQNLGK